jgi:diaminopimelate epimerase
MRIEFSKMNGAGNDFIVLGPDHVSLKSRVAQLARRLCPRRTSVGADGLILVDTSGGLFMHYYNRDGSAASFCGNGARCFVLYCGLKGIAEGETEFETDFGRHRGQVVDGGVRVSMPPARLEKELSLEIGGVTYSVDVVSAGVPHAVIILERGCVPDVEAVGRNIRSHRAFGEEGTNVDFVVATGEDEFSIRTYERGVEQETLACGSGCVSAAHVLRHRGLAGDEVALRVASGDRLMVELPCGGREDSRLVGPAVLVFDGSLDMDLDGLTAG